MPKYHVHAVVIGNKYIGKYEAESQEQAEEMAWKDAHVSVCHYCSKEIDEPQIESLVVDEIEKEEGES